MSIRCETHHDGGLAHIVLDRPSANLLDAEMIGAVRAHLAGLRDRPNLRLVVFEGAGKHFSFGASVAEHLPDAVGEMLPAFHGLFHDLEALGVPTAAVVRGQCLGGGFELATWCGRVFCDPSAWFAVPEIQLAVFPPVAAMGLRWRISGAQATHLITTGTGVSGIAAAEMGLADACVDDPGAALHAWYHSHLAALSPSALRMAWRASRRPVARWLETELPALEALYLNDLMQLRDPVEGLTAFLDKRPPQWSAR